MAVIPINLARVSNNLRALHLLEALRRNQAGLFGLQNQLATGLRVSRPSDDPQVASAALVVDRRLDVLQQIKHNLLYVGNALTESEAATKEAVELLMQVNTLVLQAVGDTVSADERAALAPVVDSIVQQLVAVGSRQYLGAYLFSGHDGSVRPFEWGAGGVIYNGDEGRRFAIVDSHQEQDFFTISGAEFFSALGSEVRGVVDLDPALTRETRVDDLRGTTGRGVALGRIMVGGGGAGETTIDLSDAATVGDILDRLNAGLLSRAMQASITTQGIVVSAQGGRPMRITIRDVPGGTTARDLGLLADTEAIEIGGADLDPRLTPRTKLADLNGGAGLDTSTEFTVRNGARSATLNVSRAETIEDVLNSLNAAGVGVWARLAADGRSLEVLNRVSGTDLRIEENGGGLATALGIRTMHAGTRLSSLNEGRGVHTVAGADLRVVTASGTVIEVDLDGAATLADVIARLNQQGGGAITAGLATTGNGLLIRDNTSGADTLRIERANLSPALEGLGLDVTAVGNTLVGRDVHPVRVNSAFTALLDLGAALRRDDTRAVAWAGERLDDALKRMQVVQGRLAAHAQAMAVRFDRLDSEATATRVLRSDVQDVDITDAVVRFQQLQNALQATIQTASRIGNLSLLDYLR